MTGYRRDRGQSTADRAHPARCRGRACFHSMEVDPGQHHTAKERLCQATTSPLWVLSLTIWRRRASPHREEATASQVQLIFQTKTNLHRATPKSHCLAQELRQVHEIQLQQRQTEVSTTIKTMPACDLNHPLAASHTWMLENQESRRTLTRAKDSSVAKARRSSHQLLSLEVHQLKKAAMASLVNLLLI